MGNDKEMILRMLLAIVLSVAVLTLFQWWFGTKEKGVKPQRTKPPKEIVEVAKVPPVAQEMVTDYGEVRVETSFYEAVFSRYGGRLKSWKLKRYMDKVELHPLGRWVQGLVAKIFGKRLDTSPPQPVDLVNTSRPQFLPLALVLEGGLYDEAKPWQVSTQHLRVEEGPKILRFLWRSEGLTVERVYTFYPDTYRVDLSVRVTSQSPTPPPWLQWVGRTDVKKSYYGFYGPLYYGEEGLKKVKPKKIKVGEERKVEGVQWFGFDQDYFISLISTPKEVPGRLRLGRYERGLLYGAFGPSSREVEYRFNLFLGPKVPELLSGVHSTAKKAIDYGTFGVIAVPILKVIKFTHKFTGNYGIDIILLALLLKIIFLPLTQKSQKAMKEMQKLGPEIKRLQQKYKDDKERLNRELMELYRRRRVNPFSGCLPLLLQLPVFFALYRALLVSIDLRHAPFVLWIRDLSDKDPTYITPLLMGATMFLQQKMTTLQGDPQQQKMMTFMPIIFTFLFLNFPSGLVLYWLATNVMGILHQLYENRRG